MLSLNLSSLSYRNVTILKNVCFVKIDWVVRVVRVWTWVLSSQVDVAASFRELTFLALLVAAESRPQQSQLNVSQLHGADSDCVSVSVAASFLQSCLVTSGFVSLETFVSPWGVFPSSANVRWLSGLKDLCKPDDMNSQSCLLTFIMQVWHVCPLYTITVDKENLKTDFSQLCSPLPLSLCSWWLFREKHSLPVCTQGLEVRSWNHHWHLRMQVQG